ncbi:hypothetical protein AWC31_20085 [Mycolicibacterium wolinskyi]|uniref:DUF6542 domain-containing protein n=3 Tax=Mycolicibacterium TaxID=1866885 RepID=A0A1X2FD35_9MYCO|nr:DUF6542 domain-containing protein [Mycolicibacterium wolinskyi]ORX16360.1 hypothetical protein AWC31_20085 [Mycolicibacterium wolinskyi]
MSGQRAESAVPADLRSVHPRFAGVPWWGAVLLAVTATAIGFAFDAGSGNRELSSVFAVCYALGCLSAVLAVRQVGVFTAVIQPPLILFVAVPGAYFLFHGGQLGGMKDLAINCGYPLIERFPLMLFTSAAVLLIGLARWYFGLTTRRPTETATSRGGTQSPAAAGFVSSITSKFSGLILRKPATRTAEDDDPAADPPPLRRPTDRRRKPGAADAGARAGRRPTKRSTPPRSRAARPPEVDLDEVAADRPRRPRSPRATEPPLVPPAEPRRRVRTQPREPRKQPPGERRGAASHDRPQRRRRFDDYEPFEDPFESSFEPPKNGHPGRSTHHPVSRVRYRGSDDEDHRAEYRTRPRQSSRGRHSWEYDS